MDSMSIQFRDLLVNEVRRRLMEENVPRIEICLSMLSDEEIWYRPNENSNSVGNLVLHLCGNVRQWIYSGLGGAMDVRQRQLEFDEKGPVPASTLVKMLKERMVEIDEVLCNLNPDDIVKPIRVQGFPETGLSVLVHVMEHFSYHTGQITFLVKWLKNKDTGYYRGLNLEVKGRN